MLTADEVLQQHLPNLAGHPVLAQPLRILFQRLLHEHRFSDFRQCYPHVEGFDFIDHVLEYLNCSYTVSDRAKENIPVNGRVIIIANHPIGSLDGLALLKLVHSCRPDVRIVANDLLETLQPLRSCLLSVKVINGQSLKSQIVRLENALANEEAVIIFPAGEVSRIRPSGIKDGRWQKGFLKLAKRAKAPVLPIHVYGRNSWFFYAVSILAKPLSTLMLVNEVFRKRKKPLKITIGRLIPYSAFSNISLRQRETVDLFRKHLYRVGSGKRGIFTTETAIAPPERRIDLKKSVNHGKLLGKTPDGKEIYLFKGGENPPVLREISRLREITFRTVGEGSGRRRDIDLFDHYYFHLILWSAEDLEIIGAYRFADANEVVHSKGIEGLYSHSLFHFDRHSFPFLGEGLELGRSFIQKRYWGRRSLDYLWYGIGAFICQNPQYRYLFGPVSISNSMPEVARELLIYFYKLYFSSNDSPVLSRNPFHFSRPVSELGQSFAGNNYRQDLIHLKSLLNAMGTSIPTLYKQYTELCQPGGAMFLDFNIDTNFNNCIDGLVVVDINQIKPEKKNRYIEGSFDLPAEKTLVKND